MVRHNNVIPNGHFHKNWQIRVKTHFDQPLQKRIRHLKRVQKARKLAPQPAFPLRPIIHCPSIRYNSHVRLGRGFTLQELKAAGINKKQARTIGIVVDYRRKNRCLESMHLNENRLKEYRSKLILEVHKKHPISVLSTDPNKIFKYSVDSKMKARKITDEEKKFKAYETLRKADRRVDRAREKRKRKAAVDIL